MVRSLHITHLKRKSVNGLFAAVPGLGKVISGMFWKTKRKTEKTVSQETFGGLEYNLVRSARRTLAMHVKSDATLVVRAPSPMPLAEIEAWIAKKARWIETHQKKFKARKTRPFTYQDGEKHLFIGQKYPLKLTRAGRGGVTLEDGTLFITTRDPGDGRRTERLLKAWYRKEAETLFEDRLDALFPLMEEKLAGKGYKKPSLKLRWMKRQWGNLHTKGVMTLNIKLVRAPTELLDYVIIHELCHLEHMNHGKGFKALLGELLPGWKAKKKALEAYLT